MEVTMTEENKTLDQYSNPIIPTAETEDEKEVKREIALRKTINAHKADPAIAEMFKLGLEAEVRADPRLLEGAAWDLKKKEYAKKVLEKMKADDAPPAAPVIPAKPITPSNPNTSTTARDEKEFCPALMSNDELLALGWSKEQIAQVKAFPPRKR